MNAAQTTRFAAPQPLLTVSQRICAAVAVTGAIVLATMGATQASHTAVHSVSDTMARGTFHVTLAPVQIVGRRDTAKRS